MVAAVVPLPLPQRRFTRAEYAELVKAGILREDESVELMRGMLAAMPPIGTEHADVVRILNRRFVIGVGDRAFVFVQSPFAASFDSEPKPDVLVVPAGDYRREHPHTALLIVEVADSTLAYDREMKAPLYAASGVPEYWLVNLKDGEIEVHTEPSDAGYGRVTRVSREANIAPRAFPDLLIAVKDLFG